MVLSVAIKVMDVLSGGAFLADEDPRTAPLFVRELRTDGGRKLSVPHLAASVISGHRS